MNKRPRPRVGTKIADRPWNDARVRKQPRVLWLKLSDRLPSTETSEALTAKLLGLKNERWFLAPPRALWHLLQSAV
jgi:hypothetical protein